MQIVDVHQYLGESKSPAYKLQKMLLVWGTNAIEMTQFDTSYFKLFHWNILTVLSTPMQSVKPVFEN